MSNSTSSYKYYTFIVTISITSILIAFLTLYKLWQVKFLILPGGVLLLSFSYFCDGLVAEVYGYKRARQLIWTKLFSIFFLYLSLSFILSLPSPPNWTLKEAFDAVYAQNLRAFVGFSVGLLLSDFVNTFVLSKWKILTQGKYFWLRSLGAAAIGEAVFSVIGGLIIYVGVVSFQEYIVITASVWSVKMLYAIVIAYPGNIAAAFLKKKEQIDIFDFSTNFNPFKLSADYQDKDSKLPTKQLYPENVPIP